MPDLVLTSTPPVGWDALCEKRHLAFSASTWHRVLHHAFGAPTLYARDATGESCVAATVFSGGPFRVAYVNFPVGGLNDSDTIDALRAALGSTKVTAMRLAASGFDEPLQLDHAHVDTPETAILDLPGWSTDALSENQRRNVRKATGAGLRVEVAEGAGHAAHMHRMYVDTLGRHRGQRRYNLAYFESLVGLGGANPNVRASVALHDGEVAGFHVAVRHGDTAYYLHGGMRLRFGQVRPSALLMHEAIRWAQELGCRRFNLMASPRGQGSLVRFKESWGGETRPHATYTIPVGRGYRLFRVAEALRNALR